MKYPLKFLLKLSALPLALFALAPAEVAHAAQFEIVYKSCPGDFDDIGDIAALPEPATNCKASAAALERGHMVLRLTGDIATGDAERLERLLDKQIKGVSAYGYKSTGTLVTVDMAGDAGSVAGAVELGAFFAHRAIQTRIRRGTTCAGPCALAFMGGRADWDRLLRTAVDRRLEAGGQLIFRSPLYPSGGAAASPDKLRELFQTVQNYAARSEIPPLLLAKILGLKDNESFPIDNVFWAKLAGITVDGVKPVTKPSDHDYISACMSQADWTYGMDVEHGDPPKPDSSAWDWGEVVFSNEAYVLVAVVWSYEGYDYWCALNTSRTANVRIPRQDVRETLGKYAGRNSLLDRFTGDDINLKGNEIYFSKAPNDFRPTRAQNGLDLLLHDPETKLAAIADPGFKWNPWTETDPWFNSDGP